MNKVRVRFAPSPTGTPHIGNTRTALFNFLFAKKNKGKFILRIEDTDKKRFMKEAEKAIYEILQWLGISWDEKYIQSDRLEIYKEHAQLLKKNGFVYEDDGALRFKMPKSGETKWTDAVGQKEISFKNEMQEDFIILKSDRYPTYNFANVVDDYLMGITHVIRGEEFISSTPKHVQLYKAFAWNQPIFAHLPIILGKDKSKLSKREGAKSVLEYREDGYLKEAILNYMALVGWTPPNEREQMGVEEMTEVFDLKDINTANPIFDTQKLEWFNGVWIRSIKDLSERLIEFYKQDSQVIKVLKSDKSRIWINAAKSRMETLKDFKKLISIKKKKKYTMEEKQKAEKLLEFLKKELGGNWNGEELLSAIKDFSSSEKTSFKKIYYLMTGKEQGIGILELNEIYGKDFFVKNLKDA
ncbi:MAG: glutamate--tRNA ligase family protein [Patescibacteria group bacterium]